MHRQNRQSDGADAPARSSPVWNTVRSLRATRTFSHDPIPEGEFERWLESARWTGSSKNSQPWRFTLVRDRTTRETLSGCGEWAKHLAAAPLVVVVSTLQGPYPFSTIFDTGRIAQSLMLVAAEAGYGSCVAVFEPEPNIERVRNLLRIPDGERVDLAIGFGRPARTSGPPPLRRGRESIETLIRDAG